MITKTDTWIQALEERLQQPLPGATAQHKMAHHRRYINVPVRDDVKQAGVLLALYPKNEEWHTVLMKRTSRFKQDKHKGQVSFPGGKFEVEDKTLDYTAKRESEEEVGLPIPQIQIIGSLTQLHIPISNFLVHPFVGIVEETPTFIPDSDEVDEIIETPISVFLDENIVRKKDVVLGTGVKLKNVPYFDINGHVVWGATGMMLSEFKHILKDL